MTSGQCGNFLCQYATPYLRAAPPRERHAKRMLRPCVASGGIGRHALLEAACAVLEVLAGVRQALQAGHHAARVLEQPV